MFISSLFYHLVVGIGFTLATLYVGLCYQLGRASIHAALQLLSKGRIKWKKINFQEWLIEGFTLYDFSERVIYRAETIRVLSASLSAVNVEVQQPYLNFLADDSGPLYVVSLLQDVGYVTEQRAPPAEGVSGLKEESVKHFPAQKVKFEGHIYASILKFTLKNGQLEVPFDFRQILGSHLDFNVAAGSLNVKALTSVIRNYDVEHTVLSGESVDKPIKEWWREPTFRSLEDTILKAQREIKDHADENSDEKLAYRYPILVNLKSENVFSTVEAWRTSKGFLLNKPIVSRVHFTRQIAKFALSRLHPLLGSAASLEGSDYIQSTVTPLNMHLPCEMMSLRLEPLKARLKTKKLLKSLTELMKVIKKKEWEEAHTLEAWTSAISANVYRSGLIESKRMDILLGHDVKHGDGLHMMMWGKVDYANETAIDMQLGLPCQTLTRLGCRDLDSDLIYFLSVKGTATSPAIDWLRAGKDILEMMAKSQLQKGLPFLKHIFRNPSEKRKSKQSIEAPPPTLPLPWQAFDEASPLQSEPRKDFNIEQTLGAQKSDIASSKLETSISQGRSELSNRKRASVKGLHQGVSFPELLPRWQSPASFSSRDSELLDPFERSLEEKVVQD